MKTITIIEPSDVENVDGLVASKIPDRPEEGRFEIWVVLNMI